MDQVQKLGNAVGIPVDIFTTMHFWIHEDTIDSLTLAQLKPKHMPPCFKHFSIKYQWFRENIGPSNIKFVKVPTQEQLGDIFTKGLRLVLFHHLQ